MTATFQPSAASAFAIAAPMPLDAPVTSAVAFSGRAQTVHSITPAPQVKPAPIAPSRTLWPGRRRPSSRESESVSGTEAARRVAELGDVVGDLRGVEVEPLADRLDDAAVGLVVDEQVDVVELEAGRRDREDRRLAEAA